MPESNARQRAPLPSAHLLASSPHKGKSKFWKKKEVETNHDLEKARAVRHATCISTSRRTISSCSVAYIHWLVIRK
jgi:hypothetical protein